MLDSNVPVYAMVVMVVMAVAALIAFTHYDHRKWETFAREHECRKVAEVRPAKDGEWTRSAYACNDGVTYWR